MTKVRVANGVAVFRVLEAASESLVAGGVAVGLSSYQQPVL